PNSGKILWKIWPNDGPRAAMWGSATRVKNYAVIGVSSNEETAVPHTPKTRGSVILLDPKDGRVIWQYYTVSAPEKAAGATAATGDEIFPPGGALTPFLPGSTLGGFHNDSAVANGIVFADGNYGLERSPTLPPFLPARCAVIAINPNGTEKWRFISSRGPSFS